MKERLNNAFTKYVECFGEDYPGLMYNDTLCEMIDRMEKCIDAGKPVTELYPVFIKDEDKV